uniref:Uncharacterized protein n=1 Tax=Oryza nivara TaxID=4536 RepID=A0A0E0GDA0_ORYNI
MATAQRLTTTAEARGDDDDLSNGEGCLLLSGRAGKWAMFSEEELFKIHYHTTSVFKHASDWVEVFGLGLREMVNKENISLTSGLASHIKN